MIPVFVNTRSRFICTLASLPSSQQEGFLNTAHLLELGTGIILVAGGLMWLGRRQAPPSSQLVRADRFTSESITETFISALPTLTRQLNLEIATTKQTELIERLDVKKVFGVNLGTNKALVRTPVTYRYHIQLKDPWQLSIRGKSIVVRAPKIRASLPPAIHTDQMQIESKRGWCRFPPGKLAGQLHHDLTAILCRYAEDPKRLDLIREMARASIVEFVQLWLEKENRWNSRSFTAIHVQFHGEESSKAPLEIE